MTTITNPTPEVLQALVPKGPWTLDPANKQLASSALRTLFAMNDSIQAFLDPKAVNVNSLMEQVQKGLGEEKIKELQAQPADVVGPMLRVEIDKLLVDKSLEEMQTFTRSSNGIRLIGEYHAAARNGEAMQAMMAMMAMKQHVESLREAVISIVHLAVAQSILVAHPGIRFDVQHHIMWSLKINNKDADDISITITRYSFDPPTPEELAARNNDEDTKAEEPAEPSKN